MDVGKWSEATRPLVTLILICTLCYLAIMEIIDAKDFMSLAMVVVLFWFKERSDSKTSEQAISQFKTIADSTTVAAVKALGTGTGQQT